ncbi:MAG: bifunctional adenosylcobinamide kinase/adenosylcobinamide-phosphate guanylyltransferase [Pseudomonadota bacterium]
MSIFREKPLVLVLGGARSGKSELALRYTEEHFESTLFLATARILDDEIMERVRLHRAARGPNWHLMEEPIEIPRVLKTECAGFHAVLVDCLTVWLSNIMIEKGEDNAGLYVDQLLDALSTRNQAVVLVSNEVGMGIVPESPLGRTFRDMAGSLNQKVAALADKVVFTVAGIPTFIKGAP